MKKILNFWFGRVEDTIIPSEKRASIWFGENQQFDEEIINKFSNDLAHASVGDYVDWEQDPHGQLALIIILDQFSRHIYRGNAKSFAQDDFALSLCTCGIDHAYDHKLSLIERVFYYFPLLHSEHLALQERSIRVFENLVDLALPETKVIYESFFKFAKHHYSIVRQFGRFPQRNEIMSRKSTKEELDYLHQSQQY